MKISHKWLAEYFRGNIPSAEALADNLSNHSYEVGHIDKLSSGDDVIEIDVLPNRAGDSLCHRGVAREVSALIGKEVVERELMNIAESPSTINVIIQNDRKCVRYIAKKICGVDVKDSPLWLKQKLESLGQRSINNIVDALNYVMFDMGQPLHAFDADKISGNISVRNAKDGEDIITLDGKPINLKEDDLVIADDLGPLAIAGVKGGSRAEIDENTKNIILEAASFSSASVRKTSRRLQIITDASKRFENGFSSELAPLATSLASSVIYEVASTEETIFEQNVDIEKRSKNPYVVGVSLSEINRLLGTVLQDKEVESVWNKLGFTFRKVSPIKTVIEESLKYIGRPYKYGASVSYDAPDFFDCSSFTAFLYAQAGVQIPRMTIDQFAFGEIVEVGDLKPGDIVFSQTSEESSETSFDLIQQDHMLTPDGGLKLQKDVHHLTREFMPGIEYREGVSHNGIYLGNDEIIHASGKWYKGQVVKEALSTSPAFSNIRGYRRMVSEENRFVIAVPPERKDLRIKEDLIEEVGRIYGLNNIEPRLPQFTNNRIVNKTLYYKEAVRDLMTSLSFDEIYTYSFAPTGTVKLLNPMSKERPYMRPSLVFGMFESLDLNTKSKELLGIKSIRLFEIGKVFGEDEERLELSVGLALSGRENPADEIGKIEADLSKLLPKVTFYTEQKGKHLVLTANLDEAIADAPQKDAYDWTLWKITNRFEKFSNFPFLLRDIAVWVGADTPEDSLIEIFTEKSTGLLKRADVFDRFEKNGKVSYAYHLVFQATDRTLTDEEINAIMQSIGEELVSRGFEIR